MSDSKWPKYETPFFFHVRDIDNNPFKKAAGATVCFIPTEHGFAPGVAVCSRQDNFNKRIGREIAHGRAEASWRDNKIVNALDYNELSNIARNLASEAHKRIVARRYEEEKV